MGIGLMLPFDGLAPREASDVEEVGYLGSKPCCDLVTLIVVKKVRAVAVGVPGCYWGLASAPKIPDQTSIGALPGLPTSFHLLAVFTSDNTIISVDQTDAGPAGDKGLESPALGVWQFGQLDVDVTLWLFWAGRNGQPLGVLRVRGRGSMDPATGKVTGPATFGFFK